MAQYLIYGRFTYTTTGNKGTVQTSITNVFTTNAASVTAESVNGLPAGISSPDSMSVAFAYRITNDTTAKIIAISIATAYGAQVRNSTNPGYVCLVRV